MGDTTTLLTPCDAAGLLGISKRQLTDLVNDGAIKFINVGRGEKRITRRFDVDDLEEYKDRNRCRSIKDPARKPTPTTSSAGEIVSLETVAALRKGKRKGLRKN